MHAGANLIPLQIFHSQNSRAGYQQLLEDAVDANMNMLRIWGGGLYQDDSLYDLADEMGILIWQEAMFACGPYPRDTDFLENVSFVSIIPAVLSLPQEPWRRPWSSRVVPRALSGRPPIHCQTHERWEGCEPQDASGEEQRNGMLLWPKNVQISERIGNMTTDFL